MLVRSHSASALLHQYPLSLGCPETAGVLKWVIGTVVLVNSASVLIFCVPPRATTVGWIQTIANPTAGLYRAPQNLLLG
jgi:hypothetical protein